MKYLNTRNIRGAVFDDPCLYVINSLIHTYKDILQNQYLEVYQGGIQKGFKLPNINVGKEHEKVELKKGKEYPAKKIVIKGVFEGGMGKIYLPSRIVSKKCLRKMRRIIPLQLILLMMDQGCLETINPWKVVRDYKYVFEYQKRGRI